MDTWLKFVLLVIAAYLLGSIPLSYLTARSRGVDIKKQGTQQVGAGNLWRTTSRKLGLFVGIYDLLKGMLMIFIAWKVGLNASMQFLVGIAVIIGHNWPVFLKFHGGRGVATALGLIIILPSINYATISTRPTIIFFAVAVAIVIVLRRTPVPILIGLISMPITSAIVKEPLSLTLSYLVLLLVIVIKRLTAQPNPEAAKLGIRRVFLNRFLYDRDISDPHAWMYRKHEPEKDIPDEDMPE